MPAGTVRRRSVQRDFGMPERSVRLQHRLSAHSALQSADSHMLQRLRRVIVRRERDLYCREPSGRVSVPARLPRRPDPGGRLQASAVGRLRSLCGICYLRADRDRPHLQMPRRVHWLPRIDRMPSDRPVRQRQRVPDECAVRGRPLRRQMPRALRPKHAVRNQEWRSRLRLPKPIPVRLQFREGRLRARLTRLRNRFRLRSGHLQRRTVHGRVPKPKRLRRRRVLPRQQVCNQVLQPQPVSWRPGLQAGNMHHWLPQQQGLRVERGLLQQQLPKPLREERLRTKRFM